MDNTITESAVEDATVTITIGDTHIVGTVVARCEGLVSRWNVTGCAERNFKPVHLPTAIVDQVGCDRRTAAAVAANCETLLANVSGCYA